MRRVMTAFVLTMVCLAASGLWMRTTHAQGTSCLVTTSSGDVQGVNAGTSCAFLNVP